MQIRRRVDANFANLGQTHDPFARWLVPEDARIAKYQIGNLRVSGIWVGLYGNCASRLALVLG